MRPGLYPSVCSVFYEMEKKMYPSVVHMHTPSVCTVSGKEFAFRQHPLSIARPQLQLSPCLLQPPRYRRLEVYIRGKLEQMLPMLSCLILAVRLLLLVPFCHLPVKIFRAAKQGNDLMELMSLAIL